MNNYVYNQIRKVSFMGIIVSGIVLISVILLGINLPFKKVFNPTKVSLISQISKARNEGNNYIEITLNDLHYTGYDYYKFGKPVASYYYNLSNNNCTFVLLNTDELDSHKVLNNYTIQGRLSDSNEETDELMRRLSNDLDWTKNGLQSISAPVYINQTAYHKNIYIFLAVLLSFIAISMLVYFLNSIVVFIFPGIHPTCLYLKKITKGRKDIDTVSIEVTNRIVLKTSNFILTKHYLIINNLLTFEIVPLGRIIWAFEHSKWHKILWHKTRLSYNLSIMYGHKIKIDSSKNTKEEIDTIINYFKENYDSIIIGYSKENKKLAHQKYKRMRRKH